MTITNNFYDGSYINTVNNFANESINKENTCFNTINNINRNKKIERPLLSFKSNKNNIISKINKIKEKKGLCKSLQLRKNTVQVLLSNKENKPLKFEKNLQNKKSKKIIKEKNVEQPSLEEKNIKEKKENKLKNKDKKTFKKKITNNLATETPKLGVKTKSHTNFTEIQPFDINSKIENNNKNNSLLVKSEESSHNILNEDIFNGIKNLNCKMVDIERLLQSNNSFKNQEYSIQNENIFGDMQIDDSITKGAISIKSSIKEAQNIKKLKMQNSNKDNLDINKAKEENIDNKEKINNLDENKSNEEVKKDNDEKILKNIEELIGKKEDNIKNILTEKFNNFKKFVEEQCLEDIKKIVFDTNFDIMTLCTDKLDEFEKFLNEKFNNLKF